MDSEYTEIGSQVNDVDIWISEKTFWVHSSLKSFFLLSDCVGLGWFVMGFR